MLYLITGVPGSGKTLKMISDLMNRKDLKNRPLYLDGISEVDNEVIPNLPIPEGETMQTWHKWAPTGAILVIDECQRVFRPRPSGSKVPDYVAELETHRHKGIDIFLLTQHPRLIDINVRSLIGHHCHISKSNLGVRRMFEWESCGDPTSRASVASAVKSVYTLDKKAFGVYKSAEEHTKIKTKLSRVVYIAPVLLAFMIAASWYIYSSWNDYTKKQTHTAKEHIAAPAASPAESAADAAAPAAAAPAAAAIPAGQYPSAKEQAETPQKPHISEDDYKPAIDGQPWTAPIYNGQNKAVQTMPYPVACVKNQNKCTCYTDQATPIKEMKKQQCLDYVADGIYNPYRRAAENTVPTAEKANEPAPPQVLVMGGKSPQNLMYDGYVEAGEQFR
ncbi:zonular occludens toxin family protein [Neisseria musculi]|uniref:Zonular occludens toxin family protein n=1 Tax=Neisseria musculi TaxID=1815583 RepID=A0A7H1MCG0_9NEIS|nr:zonular occludens toxin domain-containing protein [Neisseria musculi]QNT59325.1 zonular occludens toxin family protein [Neisseria musculi]QNT59412.1 zonular occludens toxin family protein [Neisseria musculi]